MKDISWETYQLFIAVARHGGLAGAAEATGLSAATLGRRMLALERASGRSYFRRSQTGYALTADGQALLGALGEMQSAARRIEILQEIPALPVVRLACGTWNAWFFARAFGELLRPADPFRLEMTIAEQRAQLTHRENDIGIRAVEPAERNLAAVAVGSVAYAGYRARPGLDGHAGEGSQPAAGRWIAVSAAEAISGYLRYPHDHHGAAIAVTVSRAHALRDLALAGVGIAVLPCFVGDSEPGLVRIGTPIEMLRHRQWIVLHDDDRHRRDVRLLADRLRAFMLRNRLLYEGDLPQPERGEAF